MTCTNGITNCEQCKTEVTVNMVNDRVSGVTVGNLLCDMCAANHRVSADGTICLSSTGGECFFLLSFCLKQFVKIIWHFPPPVWIRHPSAHSTSLILRQIVKDPPLISLLERLHVLQKWVPAYPNLAQVPFYLPLPWKWKVCISGQIFRFDSSGLQIFKVPIYP